MFYLINRGHGIDPHKLQPHCLNKIKIHNKNSNINKIHYITFEFIKLHYIVANRGHDIDSHGCQDLSKCHSKQPISIIYTYNNQAP